jgi:4-aminobutyrate aminotransferase/(S)-3-amino-2-methylpropionate transaminase
VSNRKAAGRTRLSRRISQVPADPKHRYIPRSYLIHHPIVIRDAEGPYITDDRGHRYIDFAGGIGVVNVGNTATPVVEAIRAQAAKLIHTGPVALHGPYLELAARLSNRLVPAGDWQTLFVNSGAEAVENAIKLARHATGRRIVIAFDRSFHGRTLLTATLTGRSQPHKSQPGSMAPDIEHIGYPYPLRAPRGVQGDELIGLTIAALDDLLETRAAPQHVAAVIVEPVQGEGGYIVPPTGFLAALSAWCRKHQILLIIDEIQTGYGRTGRFFAYEHEGVQPDIVTIGKSIADGLPLAAVTARADLWDRVVVGDIGGTFGGNPVACAAGLAVLDMIDGLSLIARSVHIGDRLRSGLHCLSEHARVAEVRGLGAMLAIEFVTNRATLDPDSAAAQFVIEQARSAGLLLIKAGVHSNVVRLTPPLIADDDVVDKAVAILVDVVVKRLNQSAGT